MDLDDSETEEEVCIDTPPEITQAVSATANLLPAKSKSQYERVYKLFMDWRRENKTDSFSENVLLAYFKNLSKRMKPSSLWAMYSMLRLTTNIKHNIDISNYSKLSSFLKRTSNGYKPKKSKILTPQQIRDFLTTAPDEKYLFTKVGLIFGIMGACRREELMKIETTHVEDLGTALLVHIPNINTKTERQFVIASNFYKICKKYMELRPPNLVNVTRFFLNYQRGSCTKQPIGINKFGSLASCVAKFLKLPDPTSYTGHCLRKSSANVLIDSGADFTALERQGQLKSTSVADVNHFLNIKIETDNDSLHIDEDSRNSDIEEKNIKLEISENDDSNFDSLNNEIQTDNNISRIGEDSKNSNIEDIKYIKFNISENGDNFDSLNNEIQIDNNIVHTIKDSKNSNNEDTKTIDFEIGENSDVNFELAESTNFNFDVGKDAKVNNSDSNQITADKTQFDVKNLGRSLISFNNCKNISNLTINIYLPKRPK